MFCRASSTLFPYTTLFRSSLTEAFAGGPCDVVLLSAVAHYVESPCTLLEQVVQGCPAWILVDRTPFLAGEDRKSTRLNSSHLGISYAVFCLKKKIRPAKHV